MRLPHTATGYSLSILRVSPLPPFWLYLASSRFLSPPPSLPHSHLVGRRQGTS